MKNLVTVVVPVYQVEKYIEKCIQSLLKQTYSKIEIIIVDDGSSDSSGSICDNIARRDSRVIVIHKANEGVAVARNVGISKAKGKYICFVDSDDYVKADYIEKFVCSMERDKVELVVCGHIRKENNLEREHAHFPQGILEKHNADFYKYLTVDIEACYPWNKLFLTEIIKTNHIMFSAGIHPGEDLLFCIHYLNYVHRVSFIKEYLYVYVDSFVSVMNRNKGRSVWDNYYMQLEPMDRLLTLKSADETYKSCCRIRIFEICCCLLYDDKKFKLHKDVNGIKKLLREYREEFNKAEYVPERIKFRYLLMSKSPAIFDIMQTLYRRLKTM